jgi:hypothetical protein
VQQQRERKVDVLQVQHAGRLQWVQKRPEATLRLRLQLTQRVQQVDWVKKSQEAYLHVVQQPLLHPCRYMSRRMRMTQTRRERRDEGHFHLAALYHLLYLAWTHHRRCFEVDV